MRQIELAPEEQRELLQKIEREGLGKVFAEDYNLGHVYLQGEDARLCQKKFLAAKKLYTEVVEGSRELDSFDLRGQHRAMATRIVQGATNKELAQEFGINPLSANQLRTSPVIRVHIARMMEEVEQKVVQCKRDMADLLPACVQTLADAVDVYNDPERLDGALPLSYRTRVALDVMKTMGVSPPKQVQMEGRILSATLTSDDVKKIKEAAIQKAAIAGVVVE